MAAAILFFTAAPTAVDAAAHNDLLPAVTASETATAASLAADIGFADEDASRRSRRHAALGHALRGLFGSGVWGAFALLCRGARLGAMLLTFLTGDGILWAFTGGFLLCGLLLWGLCCAALWALHPEKAIRKAARKKLRIPCLFGALVCCAAAANWPRFANHRAGAAALCFVGCLLVSAWFGFWKIPRAAPVRPRLWVRRRLTLPLTLSALTAVSSFLLSSKGDDLFLQHIANGAIALPFFLLCCGIFLKHHFSQKRKEGRHA